MILVHLFRLLFKALKSLSRQVFLISTGGLGASHLSPFPLQLSSFLSQRCRQHSSESGFLNWLFLAAWPHVTPPNTCTGSAHSAPIPAARYRPCRAPRLPLPSEVSILVRASLGPAGEGLSCGQSSS